MAFSPALRDDENVSVVTEGRRKRVAAQLHGDAADESASRGRSPGRRDDRPPWPGHRLGLGTVVQHLPAVAVVAAFGQFQPATQQREAVRVASTARAQGRRQLGAQPGDRRRHRLREQRPGYRARADSTSPASSASNTSPTSLVMGASSRYGRDATYSAPITRRSRDISARTVTTSRSLSSSSMARWSALRPSGCLLSSTRMSACRPVRWRPQVAVARR